MDLHFSQVNHINEAASVGGNTISTWSKTLNELDQMGGGESETCKIMIRSHKIRSGVHMPPGFKVRGWWLVWRSWESTVQPDTVLLHRAKN